MTATRTQPPPPARPARAHLPEHCVYVEREYAPQEYHDRLHFRCRSSDGRTDHQFWCDTDGAWAWCSCRGFAAHGHCTLTVCAAEVVALHYAAEVRGASDHDLADDDRTYQRRALSGRLTGGETLRWRALLDEQDARREAWEAANLDDAGRDARTGVA